MPGLGGAWSGGAWSGGVPGPGGPAPGTVPSGDPPPGRLLLRAVRILLECIRILGMLEQISMTKIDFTVNILFQLYARHADYLQALVGQEFEIVSNAITYVTGQ